MEAHLLKKRRVEYEIEGDDIDSINNSFICDNDNDEASNDNDDSDDETSDDAGDVICSYCEEQRVFDSTRKLSGHILDSHTIEGVITLSKSSVVIVRRDNDGLFRCEKCQASFESKSSFRKHLLKIKQCRAHYDANKEHATNSSVAFRLARPPPTWRTFNQAVLRACDVKATSEEENQKELFYSDRMGQYPIGMSIFGCEFNALVSKTVYDHLPPMPLHVLIKKSVHPEGYLPPWKLKESEQSSPTLSPIDEILGRSSFSKIVNQRRFTEMTKSVSDMLNLEWERVPQASQIKTLIMAGAILYNPRNEASLLLNEVEAYGRGRVQDSHRGRTGLVKDTPRKTSLPHTTNEDQYFGVRPITMVEYDGKRLEIGTFKCDILVTGCLRLDTRSDESVSVGGATQIFDISESDSKDIRIFLDEKSIENAKKAIKMSYSKITKNMGTEQLRQVRKNFHLLDTYELSRRSGPLTDSTSFRPITIFTYANHCNDNGAGFGAGLLFNRVGQSVILQKENAALEMKDVKLALQHCKNSREVLPIVNTIHALFEPGTQKIPIIGNFDLNSSLESLSEIVTRKIVKLNVTRKKEVMKLFGIQ